VVDKVIIKSKNLKKCYYLFSKQFLANFIWKNLENFIAIKFY